MASMQVLCCTSCSRANLRLFPRTNVRRCDTPSNAFFTITTTTSRPRLQKRAALFVARARAKSEETASQQEKINPKGSSVSNKEEKEEEEEDLPWIQEKALDLVEFTGTVTQAIPGPRVGQSSLPWFLAIPLAYVGVSFVFAFVRTVKKFTSPMAKKRRSVNKNAELLKSIDELLLTGRDSVKNSDLMGLMQKTGFTMEEILRKYIRYALNEKPFNPDLIVDLIHLRKASMLDDAEVAEVLNEVSKRIVQQKGPVVLELSGFTEKGFKRKLAVQGLFRKILYLSELPEFCSRDSSLVVKEIFGVTDQDADTLRIHTLSETVDMDSLEKLVDGSDSEEPDDGSSPVS